MTSLADSPPMPGSLGLVAPSGIRAIANRAWGRPGVLRVDLGEPDQALPAHVADALGAALSRGEHRYGPTSGLPALREALVEKLAATNGLDTEPDAVSVCAGGVEGLYAAYRSLLDTGDEVLVPDPGWPNLRGLAHLVGATPVGYPSDAADLVDQLDRLHTDRTRAVVLNTPANPTGAVLAEDVVRDVLGWAARRRLPVVSDECYDELWLDRPAACVAALAAGMEPAPAVVSVFSFSKTHSMTGLRLGYVVAPGALTGRLQRVQETVLSCVSTPTQHAGLAAVTGSQDHVRSRRDDYRERRDLALAELTATESGLAVAAMPRGAFYLWLRLPPGCGPSAELALRLLEQANVALAPGSAFGPAGEGHLRVSLATSAGVVLEALRRLADHLAARP